MRLNGRLSSWNDDKGFGFIAPQSGGQRVFVHISAFPPRGRRPSEGADVSYEIGRDETGRERAENARLDGVMPAFGPAARAFMVAAGFLVLLTGAAAFAGIPRWIPWLYLALSALTFGVYALDKRAAVKGRQRTPEVQLHLWALLGGWPGALFAQQLLRHKSSKFWFRLVFWITLLANLGALGFVLSPRGAWIRTQLDRLPDWQSILQTLR